MRLDKNSLITAIITNFYNYLENLSSSCLLQLYRDRLAFVGSTVDILKNGEKVDEGQVLGVDENYKLQVKTPTSTTLLDSGEISTRLTK